MSKWGCSVNNFVREEFSSLQEAFLFLLDYHLALLPCYVDRECGMDYDFNRTPTSMGSCTAQVSICTFPTKPSGQMLHQGGDKHSPIVSPRGLLYLEVE